jgi:anthranilate synthase component 2
MILLIDNYDSFVHNLARYVRELGFIEVVQRNDAITIEQIETLGPSHIIISPGPCTPDDAGVSLSVIQHFAKNIPILGICLGHQAIAQAFGGEIIRAKQPTHGKASAVTHNQQGIFKGLPNPFKAARYHSLAVNQKKLPTCLEITARTEDDEIMGLQHQRYPTVGVQFHPESILTEGGYQLMSNFLNAEFDDES